MRWLVAVAITFVAVTFVGRSGAQDAGLRKLPEVKIRIDAGPPPQPALTPEQKRLVEEAERALKKAKAKGL